MREGIGLVFGDRLKICAGVGGAVMSLHDDPVRRGLVELWQDHCPPALGSAR